MRIAYLHCFAGISGDMFLGALLHAGVPAAVLEDAVAALPIDAALTIETVDRSGIGACKVNVSELSSGRLFEAVHQHPHCEAPDAGTAPGRSLGEIVALLQSSSLKAEVSKAAIGAFELLGHTEARIHNVPVEAIHFHEVGAADAIVDIVAACAGIHHLAIDAWYASAVNVGSGTVECAHGRFPVPAPATAELLRGFPTYSAHLEKELTTPTGAALLRTLMPSFGPQPPMRVEAIGYGAGTRNPEAFPNLLRLSIGESIQPESLQPESLPPQNLQPQSLEPESDTVVLLETALDDLSPQILSYAAEKALAEGALDVMLTPVLMKKGRPGTLLTILCQEERREALQALVFRETSTLGIRVRRERRVLAARRHISVLTEYGAIRVKIGAFAGADQNIAPEFEDCRAAAELHRVPLKTVQQAALFAYRKQV